MYMICETLTQLLHLSWHRKLAIVARHISPPLSQEIKWLWSTKLTIVLATCLYQLLIWWTYSFSEGIVPEYGGLCRWLLGHMHNDYYREGLSLSVCMGGGGGGGKTGG